MAASTSESTTARRARHTPRPIFSGDGGLRRTPAGRMLRRVEINSAHGLLLWYVLPQRNHVRAGGAAATGHALASQLEQARGAAAGGARRRSARARHPRRHDGRQLLLGQLPLRLEPGARQKPWETTASATRLRAAAGTASVGRAWVRPRPPAARTVEKLSNVRRPDLQCAGLRQVRPAELQGRLLLGKLVRDTAHDVERTADGFICSAWNTLAARSLHGPVAACTAGAPHVSRSNSASGACASASQPSAKGAASPAWPVGQHEAGVSPRRRRVPAVHRHVRGVNGTCSDVAELTAQVRRHRRADARDDRSMVITRPSALIVNGNGANRVALPGYPDYSLTGSSTQKPS